MAVASPKYLEAEGIVPAGRRRRVVEAAPEMVNGRRVRVFNVYEDD